MVQESPDISFELQNSPRGVLWLYVQLMSKRETGLLVLQWSTGGRSQFRKEIAFQAGEPLSIRTNRLQETFGYFLVQKKRLSRENLDEALQEQKNDNSVPIGEILLKRQLLEASEMTPLLRSHFYQRLMSVLSLRRGTVEFKRFEHLPEDIFRVEPIRLADPLSKAIWPACKEFFDEAYCRSRFSGKSHQPIRVSGEFPFALSGAELRLWNQLCSEYHDVSSLSLLGLQLVTVAREFEQLEWGKDPQEELYRELSALQEKFSSATPWQILNVEKGANAAECKKAQLEYVRKYHPDRLPLDSPDSLRAIAEKVLSQVNEAYGILGDPDKRQEYEAQERLQEEGGLESVEARLQAELKLEDGRQALKRKHFQAAFDVFDEISSLMPDHPQLQADHVYASFMLQAENKQLSQDQVREYHQKLDQCLARHQNYAEAHYYKALLHKWEGDDERALHQLDEALEIEPKLAEAASEARLIRSREGKQKKGKSWFSK